MRRSRLTALVGLAGLALTASAFGVASASAHPHGAPVFRNPPAKPPATVSRHHVCTLRHDSDRFPKVHGRVWVDQAPTGATAVWLPGLNDQTCKSRITQVSASDAARIARAVDRAGHLKGNGPISCPDDDGTGLRLYLGYRDGKDEYLRIGLTGCASVDAPGRSDRFLTDGVRRALQQSAPPAWQAYLH